MSESLSQQEEKRNPEQEKSFGYDDLSAVGKCVVDFYRTIDTMEYDKHRKEAIEVWLNFVTVEEKAFLKEEARKMAERVTGGVVMQALTLTAVEWKKMKDEENMAIWRQVSQHENAVDPTTHAHGYEAEMKALEHEYHKAIARFDYNTVSAIEAKAKTLMERDAIAARRLSNPGFI